MSSSSGIPSEVSDEEIDIPINKRIGRLRKQNEVTEVLEKEPCTQIKPSNLGSDFNVDSFLKDLDLSDLDSDQPLSDEESKETCTSTFNNQLISEKIDSIPSEVQEGSKKRAPVSKKNLENIKKITDSMVRTAPLAINEAISVPSSTALNISGFLQRFEEFKLKKVSDSCYAEPSCQEIPDTNLPNTPPKTKDEKYSELMNKIKAFSLKKHLVGPTIEIGAPSKKENKRVISEKRCTLSQLNSLLIHKMAEKTHQKQLQLQTEKKVEEVEEDCFSGSDESFEEDASEKEAPITSKKRVDINDSSLAESASEDNDMCFDQPEASGSKFGELSAAADCTVNYTFNELNDSNLDSTLPFTTTAAIPEDSRVVSEQQGTNTEPSLGYSDILGDHHPSLSKPKLNIKPKPILSCFDIPPSQDSTNPVSTLVSSPKEILSGMVSEYETDEEVLVTKPKKREYLLSDMESEEDNSKPGLTRLVKKSEMNQEMNQELNQGLSPMSEGSIASLSEIRNFVADQALEEDDDGELIAYSGSEEDYEENEYDFDDLELDYDGPMNHDAMRELHNKAMRDAENKGYKLLTRKDPTSSRILGDDDGHQLARRQRNRNGLLDFEEVYSSKISSLKGEECVIANFKTSAVNNINDLKLRINRNKSSRRTRSGKLSYTDDQIQRALSDPDPRMALFRASLNANPVTSESNNSVLLKQALSRSSTIHGIPKRFKPLNKSNSETAIKNGTLAQVQFKSFLHGNISTNLSNTDPTARADHINQLKRQFDTKAPENQITNLSMTNARRFGYSSFKIYGKRSALSDPKNTPLNKKS